MNLRAPFALIIERDTAQRALWATQVADGENARVMRRARPSEVGTLIAPGARLSTLVVGLSAQGDCKMIDVIAQARKVAPQAVIIAVDHGDDPEMPAIALGAGADDYLRADHHPSEFSARLRARSHRVGDGTHQTAQRAALGLTPIEERILDHLSKRRGEIVTRTALAHDIGQADWSYGDRKFDVHIARIRRKLRDTLGDTVSVRTIRSRGYLLDSETAL